MGLNSKKFDQEGRHIELHHPEFILLGSYYPNGQRDHSRVGYKLDFSESVLQRALELQKKYQCPIFLCGDFNTAHREIDLANPQANKNTTGFLPEEREWMDRLIRLGFTDSFRYLYPQKKECYTWWTYRNQCRERNIGWRLDYFL